MHILLILPIAVIMCLSPFFSPFVGVKLAQRDAWIHRCDPFPAEVILKGTSFDDPKEIVPHAFFCFGESRHRTQYYEYNMTRDTNDTMITGHLRFSGFAPDVTIPDQDYPLVQDILYYSNGTFGGSCASHTNSTLTPCMNGSFDQRNYLYMNVTDTVNNNSTALRSVDDEWAFFPAEGQLHFVKVVFERDGCRRASGCRTYAHPAG